MDCCRLCPAPGLFGFSEPGLYSERKRHGYVWTCADHRAEVEQQWRARFEVKVCDYAPATTPKQGVLL